MPIMGGHHRGTYARESCLHWMLHVHTRHPSPALRGKGRGWGCSRYRIPERPRGSFHRLLDYRLTVARG
jgi:hypothetical protein